MNSSVQKLIKEYKINFYASENEDIKGAVIERFNRTLKTKMWKYFTHENTMRYVDVLDDLMHSYNNTFHTTIKMAPSGVNAQNEERSEQDCTDLNLNWFGNFKLEIKYVFREARVNSRRDTYRVGQTRFSPLHLVDRRIHPYTQSKITTVKS